MKTMKYSLACMLVFLSVYLFGEEIVIQYPNFLKMYADGVTSYTIKTDEAGMIYEISSDSESDGICVIEKNGNELIFQHDFKNGDSSDWKFIKKFILDKTVIQESNKKRVEDKTPFVYNTIILNPSNQSVYRGEERSLEKDSSKLLAENKNTRCIVLFNNGITYYSYISRENIQWKYEYEKQIQGYNAFYCYAMSDENDVRFYERFPEKITIPLNNLYSSNEVVNLVNYIILETYNSNLATVLFPLLFLEHPFQENPWQYSASSFLQEGNTKYGPENLGDIDGNPWASSNGFGIGDIITINMPVRSQESLVIYNGFQSEEKPYLYMQNSRVKEIEITYRELGKHKTVTLLDKPEAQEIDISDILGNIGETAAIDIKILDVYPGEKYKDLCVQAIVPKVIMSTN